MAYNHSGNLRIETGILKDNMYPGMIIRFDYTDQKNNTSRRYVLVLEKDDDGKLHGVDIEHVSERELYDVMNSMSKELTPEIRNYFLQSYPNLRFLVGSDERSRMKDLYETVVRDAFDENAYRLFNLDRMSSTYLMNYITNIEREE